MSEPYIGQIMQVGFPYAPRGWSTCQGQIMNIAQNSTLFALLGVIYGGDGRNTFGLPDARGRTFVGTGQAPALQNYQPGQVGGTENVTLTTPNMPAHTHAAVFAGTPSAISASGTLTAVTGPTSQSNVPTEGAQLTQPANIGGQPVRIYAPADSGGTPVNLGGITITSGDFTPQGSVSVGLAGGNLPISILSPYLGITTVIALQGVYPTRN